MSTNINIGMVWNGMVWYVLSTENPRWNQSSALSFGLLKVSVALSFSEPILHFEVGKAVE